MNQNSSDASVLLRHSNIPILPLISMLVIIIVINFAERENHQIGTKRVARSRHFVFCHHTSNPMIKTKEKTLRKLFVFYSLATDRREARGIFNNLLKGTDADFRKVKHS
ncbi:MAG: hypothetical protein EPO62_00655 [Candidatus Nitrosotenuis sp.]|nr:MAG: hypothetical protein EPO62_00655 [Candidatus Nitrosotenuis sp.]